MRSIIFALILALLVTACGAKGPLYIPDKKYPQPGDQQDQDKAKIRDKSKTQDDTQPQDTNNR